ncbi:YARHG domain-containing protein [bacterium]|nr:YARHG domain-containing protein [bacterium]
MADFASVLPAGDELLSHQEVEEFVLALVYNGEDETDGTALLRHDGQRWTLLSRVGGTFSAEDLHRLGVPDGLWNRLLVNPIGETEREEALQSGPGWPLTEEIQLSEEDLIGLTEWERLLMASEILARRGCPFDESPLREYFESRSWYEPDDSFTESCLSPIEKANLAFLR